MKNLFFKEFIWPLVIIAITSLVDIILRGYSITELRFLTKSLFSVNIIEILIILIFIIFAYRFLPLIHKKQLNCKRAKAFLNNWHEFKIVLQKYQNTKKGLQQKYSALRNKIEIDFNYFVEDIIKIQKATHRDYQDVVLRNFESCWQPRLLSHWQSEVRRQIPNELDCFDYILISLIEHSKK